MVIELAIEFVLQHPIHRFLRALRPYFLIETHHCAGVRRCSFISFSRLLVFLVFLVFLLCFLLWPSRCSALVSFFLISQYSLFTIHYSLLIAVSIYRFPFRLSAFRFPCIFYLLLLSYRFLRHLMLVLPAELDMVFLLLFFMFFLSLVGIFISLILFYPFFKFLYCII